MTPNSFNEMRELVNETGKEFFQLMKTKEYDKEFNNQIISYNDKRDEIKIKFPFHGYTMQIFYLKHIIDYDVICNSTEYMTTVREFLNYIKKELRKNKIKNIRNDTKFIK